MNIFLKELKSHRKSLIIWSVCVFLMVASGMMKYQAYSTSGQNINEIVGSMPKSMRVIMGFVSGDLSKAGVYFAMLYLYLLLMATIHAAMLGATMFAKEERDKTSEFLFVKPVSRSTVITAKLLAAFVNIVIFNLVTLVSSVVLVGQYNKGESVNREIAVLMVAMFILQLMFMVIGSALAAVKKKPKSAASLATGILLLTYMLSIIIDLKDANGLKFFTPFKYFEAKNIMNGSGLEPVYVILSIILIAVLTMITYVFYKKRDLNV